MNPASASPAEEFERVSADALDRLPNVEIICTCLRVGEFANQARLVAVGRTRSESHRSAEREIPSMVDRIGTGDAFAAGVLHRKAERKDVENLPEQAAVLLCLLLAQLELAEPKAQLLRFIFEWIAVAHGDLGCRCTVA